MPWPWLEPSSATRHPRRRSSKSSAARERAAERSSGLFRQETGLSLGLWRQEAGMLNAIRLLAEGKAVTTVALDAGYASLSAFIAAFRKTFGYTPGRFADRRE